MSWSMKTGGTLGSRGLRRRREAPPQPAGRPADTANPDRDDDPQPVIPTEVLSQHWSS